MATMDLERDYLLKIRENFTDLSRQEIRIGRKLGVGTYGEVREAWINRTDRVAIKIFKRNEDAFNEMRILKSLEGVDRSVQLKGFYVNRAGKCVQVMEIVGSNLYQLCLSQFLSTKLSMEEIFIVAKQLLEYVSELKERRIIHGDIKPENISFDRSTKKLKVFDPGIGFFQGEVQYPSLIQSSSYRHPAVMLGLSYKKGELDLFSVGNILFELFTGHQLFNKDFGKDGSFEANMNHLVAMAQANIHFPKHFAIEAKNGSKYFKKMQEDPFSKQTYSLRKPVILPKKGKRVKDVLLGAFRNRRLRGEVISKVKFLEFVDLLNGLLSLDPRCITVSNAMSHPCFRKKTHFRFNFIGDSKALKKPMSLKLFTAEGYERNDKIENCSANLSTDSNLCLRSCRPDKQNLYVLRLFFDGSEDDFKDYFIEIPDSGSIINIAYDDEWSVKVQI